VNFYVWERRDCLILELQLWILFVRNVADGPGQIQISVDSTLDIDGGAGFVDSIPLLFEVGLMVRGEWNCSSSFSEDASGVASVGTDKQGVDDHQNVGGTSFTLHHLSGVLIGLDLGKGTLVSMES